MGIIYQTIIRSHIVKDIGSIPEEPWTENSNISAAAYLKDVKKNCLETHHEIYIDAISRRNLHIMNYPIHPKANSLSFTNFACDEYDGAYFEITFLFENGQTHTEEIHADSSSLSRFMLIVPKQVDGTKAKSVSYHIGTSPATNCYDLKNYDGSKHSSTEDDFYREFRCVEYECPVCYLDQDFELESDCEIESEIESKSTIEPSEKNNNIPKKSVICHDQQDSRSESMVKLMKESQESPNESCGESKESTKELLVKSKSDPGSDSNSEVNRKIVSLKSNCSQLHVIFHKIRAIFKYLDTNGIFRRPESIKRRSRKFVKSTSEKSEMTLSRQLSTLSDVFITTLNY